MNYILFDDNRTDLLPFTYTRPVSEIRCGIRTITEKWEDFLGTSVSFLTENYLSKKYTINYQSVNCYVNGSVFPNQEILLAINELKENQVLYDASKEKIIAFVSSEECKQNDFELDNFEMLEFSATYLHIDNVWDIFTKNAEALKEDFYRITIGRKSQELNSTNTIIGDEVFLEEGAIVNASILNATNGPIYIGKDAEIMEGSVVRGGLALCEGGVLKLATKIYGATTVGPFSKVGGEVNNSVIFGYSNKGHDGFLGNSVLGEWCNLGADTNVSNLKNNYANIKIWNFNKEGFKDTGRQFCGMMMGDHSKSGINTMFNTATVVGVSANIFGGGFPRNFIPSFAWGGSEKWMTYRTNKAYEVAEKMMERRGIPFTKEDVEILDEVFEQSKKYRNF